MEDTLIKDKFTAVNWNAGTNFNNIIQFIIENIVISKVEERHDVTLSLLNTLFSISYPKIISYALKMNDINKVQEKCKEIKVLMTNAKIIINKRNKKEINDLLSRAEFQIYNIMGKYGVLFPYEENQEKENKLTAYINQR